MALYMHRHNSQQGGKGPAGNHRKYPPVRRCRKAPRYAKDSSFRYSLSRQRRRIPRPIISGSSAPLAGSHSIGSSRLQCITTESRLARCS